MFYVMFILQDICKKLIGKCVNGKGDMWYAYCSHIYTYINVSVCNCMAGAIV